MKPLANRKKEIERILEFVRAHRNSYASLAVCRRALDQGLSEVTEPVIAQLEDYLAQAPDEEIAAYYTIVM